MLSALRTDGNYTMQFWKGWYEVQFRLILLFQVIIPCSFGRAGMRDDVTISAGET